MCGVQIAKIATSFSLILLIVAAFGGEYRELQAKIEKLSDPKQIASAIQAVPGLIDRDDDLKKATEDLDTSGEYSIEEVKAMVALRADAEPPGQLPTETAAKIRDIKSSGLYRDPGIQDQSNWLDGAFRRLASLIPHPEPKANVPNVQMGGLPNFIVPLMWGFLAVAVLVFGYFAIRHFQWRSALRRRAKAMLEDDEPERTLDEWLVLADQLSAEGRYREAVRAMYLSCLLKFDEAGIARFIRGETNWEHLERIHASPKRPATIDFLAPTKLFDHIWYGFHVRGLEDVAQFKAWYMQISEILRGVAK